MTPTGGGGRYFITSPRGAPANTVRCILCPRSCSIPAGESGRCGVRVNRDGAGAIPFYGRITSMAADPIEKKPLYHYRPGVSILSLGFLGCNLYCPFCQNWRISQDIHADTRHLSPEDAVAAALAAGFTQLAYTYSEPLIHIEYLLDCMKIARERGIANVLVSNGCLQKEAAADILALTDAANIDLKSFSPDTYSRTLGGNLTAVLEFITLAYRMGVHLEVTTLIVPDLNDGEKEIEGYLKFLTGLSPHIPWHLSAYHPGYRWDAPPTDASRLEKIARRAREDLAYVYTGNIPGETNDTPCPHCGSPLVRRRGYSVNTRGLVLKKNQGKNTYYCARCAKPVPVIRF
ncbi:MAG: AmmeMemoRadiSam system radical SAM enzyme [Spirochaetaceae bacterium]|nr:AmmeMemoRadiSam system radical SAM enzyme [Spirochaetaceae bacterium]